MAQTALRKGVRRALLTLVAAGALLAAGEVGLRLAGYAYAGRDDPIAIWNADEDRRLRLGNGLHRVAEGELWHPRPGALLPEAWTGAPERVNAAGYRGPARPRARTAGVLRVATLGDSSTFGYGVPYSATYSAQLEARLAEQGVAAEVLDFGVVGFTVLQGIERYARRVREYRPDVVVAAFGSINEHHVAQGLPDEQKIARSAQGEGARARFARRAREELRLAQWLASVRDRTRPPDPPPSEEEQRRAEALHASLPYVGLLDYESAHGGVRRVPLARFEAALEELAALVAADGARLVVVSMPHRPGVELEKPILRAYSEAVTRFAKRTGTALFDVRVDFRIYREIEHGDPTTLYLDGDDVHPSPRGHARMGRGLCKVVADLEAAR